VDRVFSNWTSVVSGISQRSVLGTLLFIIIYINDLVDSLCDNVNIHLFADDAKLYAHIKYEQDELVLQKHFFLLLYKSMVRSHPKTLYGTQ